MGIPPLRSLRGVYPVFNVKSDVKRRYMATWRSLKRRIMKNHGTFIYKKRDKKRKEHE
jgi:hypothetical protein